MPLSQTAEYKKVKASYGGSDRTAPSFLSPDHVIYNSVSKARDLGVVENLNATLSGTIGSQSGSNTLFFKVVTTGSSDLLITRNSISKYEDQYVSVGILDENRKQLQITANGYAYENEVINTDEEEFLLQMPAGTYYFTVNSSLWQSLPYSASIRVLLYRELIGTASVTATPYARIALVKLVGAAEVTAPVVGTIPSDSTVKSLAGNAGGTDQTYGLIIINSVGVALLTCTPYGRLKATWRIEGVASGTSSNVGTLTVTTPYY